MTNVPADSAWQTASNADVDVLDRSGVDQILVAVRLARSHLDAVEIRAARRLRHLAASGRSEAPEHAIAAGTGQSNRDARDVTARDELCERQPSLEDALDSGDLTSAHLDAINRAGRGLPPDVRDEYLAHSDDLLERARRVGPEQFARECRELAKHLLAHSRRGSDADELEAQRAASKVTRWVDRSTGMHHTMIELDPIRDAKLNSTISRALARLRSTDQHRGAPWPQLLVDATLDAICGATDDPRRGPVDRVPEITIVVDHARLLDAAERHGLCETESGVALPVSTVRRLCCDAEIIPAVMNGASEVLDQGRSKRTATPSQRRALRAMYATCANPSCTVAFDACRIHHVRHWLEHHGPTDLSNLLPLCEVDHHLVHEGGWGLALEPDRTAVWTRPDGVVHHRGPSTNRRTHPVDTAAARSDAVTPQDARPQLTLA